MGKNACSLCSFAVPVRVSQAYARVCICAFVSAQTGVYGLCYVEIGGMRFMKPFVEKPLDAEVWEPCLGIHLFFFFFIGIVHTCCGPVVCYA